MARKYSRRIVIDASVARACGTEGATHLTATRCRDVLKLIVSVCHRAVFNAAIQREWQRHESGFARRWRVQMVSRRKLVRTGDEDYPDLEAAISVVAVSAKEAKQLRKDVHLVQAALRTDRVIVSLDCEARDGFRSLSSHFGRLKRLKWLDPGNEYEQLQAWLKGGK